MKAIITKHTATPWNVCKCTPSLIEAVCAEVTAFDDGKRIIVQTLDPIPHIGNTAINANAEFIVRACNSHDELVQALQAFADVAEDDDKYISFVEDARAVLAKAGV